MIKIEHLIKNYGTNCAVDDIRFEVEQGETIALVGSTGNSTGAHCHFEIYVNGTRVDPLPYVS